eukprot:GHVU01000068.1.p1 GENE.GHVU01000068.1~~GHVU01000068.1.p1  ORF type:complete len:152 (+),score=4.58 GHVU01000068.1:35-490(+)
MLVQCTYVQSDSDLRDTMPSPSYPFQRNYPPTARILRPRRTEQAQTAQRHMRVQHSYIYSRDSPTCTSPYAEEKRNKQFRWMVEDHLIGSEEKNYQYILLSTVLLLGALAPMRGTRSGRWYDTTRLTRVTVGYQAWYISLSNWTSKIWRPA